MEGLNRVTLIGNLGAEPELKTTQSGQSVLKLRVATSERYQDKQGQWQDRTEWHSVTVWGKRAESLAKLLTKGSALGVEGSLHTSSYEDRDGGGKRYRTEVNAQRVLLLGGKRADGNAPASTPDADPPEAPPAPVGDDDLPF